MDPGYQPWVRYNPLYRVSHEEKPYLQTIEDWQMQGPIWNFENCSGETKEEGEKFNTKPKKALAVKLLMRQVQGVPLTYTPLHRPDFYLKIYLFKFLYANFQTSLTLFNVFYSSTLFSRHIAKMEAKIEVFHKFIHKYWFSSILFGETIIYFVWINIFINIFTAVLDYWCQNFTEIPKNSDFWLKLPVVLQENNVMLVLFSEI